MRLLTHNVLNNNNSPAAKGNGYPLRLIRVTSVRVDSSTTTSNSSSATTTTNDDNDAITMKIEFIKGILPTLHWSALLQATKAVGILTLPEILQEDMIDDTDFLLALYHILLHVHVVEGILQCPSTHQQFMIHNEIPNFVTD